MDGVSWTDLDPTSSALLRFGAGVSVELCDRVALLTLARLGLVRGGQLTPAADQLRRAAILPELAARKRDQHQHLSVPCGRATISLEAEGLSPLGPNDRHCLDNWGLRHFDSFDRLSDL